MDKQIGEQRKDIEQLILDAAIKEFSTKGFDGARTASIAAGAGVTHAMLHYYFRTKERLFTRIFEDKFKDIMQLVLAPVMSSEGPLKERIARGMEAHFDFLMQNRWLPLFFVTTLNSNPELYNGLLSNLINSAEERIGGLQKQFDKAFEAGEIRKTDVRMLFGDIASLNLLPFVATDMFMAATGFSKGREDEFFAARRKENVETVINRMS